MVRGLPESGSRIEATPGPFHVLESLEYPPSAIGEREMSVYTPLVHGARVAANGARFPLELLRRNWSPEASSAKTNHVPAERRWQLKGRKSPYS
jgi:hypothetical protein